MNANELADYWMKYPLVENAEETATMLRQQQAREDSLCSMVIEYQDKVDELRNEIEALKAHPVKELTDEEIIILWNDFVDRAILKKAQEK